MQNRENFSYFGVMSLSALKSTIRRVMKEKRLTLGYVSNKIGISEKTLSDWLGKNTTMDVFDLQKISNAVEYNFFNEIKTTAKGGNKTNEKKVRILITLEVEDAETEKEILSKLMDVKTVKSLLD